MDEREQVAEWYSLRADLVASFFEANAEAIASLCRSVAERFVRGGRLLAFGAGAASTDAQHVAVEFVHPVIVGKRALPAIALPNDAPTSLGLAMDGSDTVFARQLQVLGSPEDIALGMTHHRHDVAAQPVAAGLKQAASMGLTSVALTGPETSASADHVFTVDVDDPFVVQEIHETLYHVVWELVHVFFEHGASIRAREADDDPGRAGFLYPFLDAGPLPRGASLDEIASSVVAKASDVVDLRATSSPPAELIEIADAIASRVQSGGKIVVFGNGGSATDAEDLVVDLVAPPDGMKPVPALALTHDVAVITAVANDVGYENAFARQVIAHAGPNDVAVAISTSGGSRNVVAAIEEAQRRGSLTVAIAGYSGGRLKDICDHVLVVQGDYVPRIQEAQATQYHCVRRLLGARLG